MTESNFDEYSLIKESGIEDAAGTPEGFKGKTWDEIYAGKGVDINASGIAVDDGYEQPMNPDGSDPSVMTPEELDQLERDAAPDEPGWMENLTNWAGDNPGTALGGLAGLGLGVGGLAGGGMGMGLLGASTPILGYLYDQYSKTGRMPWQDYSESAPQTLAEAADVISSGGIPEAGELGIS